MECAGVAELADAADSKSAVPCGLEGSSPSSGTSPRDENHDSGDEPE